MKSLLSVTHPHVVQNLYDFLTFVEHKRRILKITVFVHTMKVSLIKTALRPHWLSIWTFFKIIFCAYFRRIIKQINLVEIQHIHTHKTRIECAEVLMTCRSKCCILVQEFSLVWVTFAVWTTLFVSQSSNSYQCFWDAEFIQLNSLSSCLAGFQMPPHTHTQSALEDLCLALLQTHIYGEVEEMKWKTDLALRQKSGGI